MYLGSLSKIRLERRRKGEKRMNNIVSWAGITHSSVVRSWECSARGKYWDLFWAECVLHWPRLLLSKIGGTKYSSTSIFLCVHFKMLCPNQHSHKALSCWDLSSWIPGNFSVKKKAEQSSFCYIGLGNSRSARIIRQSDLPALMSNHLENGCSRRLQWAHNWPLLTSAKWGKMGIISSSVSSLHPFIGGKTNWIILFPRSV